MKKNSTLTLEAGSYGNLETKKGAVITFTGGVYRFSEWNLGDDAKITLPLQSRYGSQENLISVVTPSSDPQLARSLANGSRSDRT